MIVFIYFAHASCNSFSTSTVYFFRVRALCVCSCTKCNTLLFLHMHCAFLWVCFFLCLNHSICAVTPSAVYHTLHSVFIQSTSFRKCFFLCMCRLLPFVHVNFSSMNRLLTLVLASFASLCTRGVCTFLQRCRLLHFVISFPFVCTWFFPLVYLPFASFCAKIMCFFSPT